jgi:hypothetical protein
VQVWTGDDAWDDRGPTAGARLVEQLAGDPVVRGSQIRSDVHPGLPAFTLFFAVRNGTGYEARTLVLNVRSKSIVRAAYYAL